MQMRYFQPLWDIVHRYEEWLEIYDSLDNVTEGCESDLHFKRIKFENIKEYIGSYEQTKEEYEAIRYLANVRLNISHDRSALKPTTEVVNRVFDRYLYYLEYVHDVVRTTKKTPYNKIVYKQMECCYYYLFKFTLPAWVDKLPPYIPTFEEKYHKKRVELETEADIDIDMNI